MEWYYYIAAAFIVTQVLYCLVCYRNYRFVLSKGRKLRDFIGKAALIIPCKGIDDGFEANITSFFQQDYDDYSLIFVVGEESDPAYSRLLDLKSRLSPATKATDIKVLVAGATHGCSQKIHNLLFACRTLGPDIVAIAFADSDICVRPDWLGHILHPLRRPGLCGISSGYRLFVPAAMNSATLALASINAAVAQMLGPYGFNHAWGGSMAIRREVFEQLGVAKEWATSISDDLSLSRLVQQAGMKIAFVPGCLVASYVKMTWNQLFEFARRQFVITRVATPRLWLMGLAASAYSVAGLWGSAIAAAMALRSGHHDWPIFAAVSATFFMGHFCRAWLRQRTVSIVLDEKGEGLKAAIWADILLAWLWSPLMFGFILISAVGRRITWRGIRYKLLGPSRVAVLGHK